MHRILLTLAALLTAASGEGRCQDERLCCAGRDSNCVVQKVDGPVMERPCYCDAACLDLGDCCPDYVDTCAPRDCEVGDWSEWSPCTACGGQRDSYRTRDVLREAERDGAACPELHQQRPCPSPSSPCRRVSVVRRRNSSLDFGDGWVCERLEVTRASRACLQLLSSSLLPIFTGETWCVWSQSKGMPEEVGRKWKLDEEWDASGCEGKWRPVPTTPGTECKCQPGDLHWSLVVLQS